MIGKHPQRGHRALQVRRKVAKAALAAGVASVLSGCVDIEYDKMSGTTFPPELIELGQPLSIQTIYFDAGRLVFLNPDDENIPPLNIGDNECITDAELDALENANRSAPLFPVDNRYFLYGVTVDHHAEYLDACVPEWILGKLWNWHTRSAFALFYPHPTIVSGSAEYLRTAAHEIGHALNLHHEDGDGSTTIMNQTGDINDNWTFTFSNASLDHLQDHPTKCTYPGAVGGAPFLYIDASHAAHLLTTVYDCD